MPGLMSQGAAANRRPQSDRPQSDRSQPDRAARQQPQAGGGQRKPGQNVTAEEQDMYDATVGQAYNLIYDDKAMPAVLERLAAGDPVESLATTTVMVMARVEDSAMKEDIKIPGDVMLHAGMEVLGDLAGLAADANIHTFDKSEKEAALYQALDQYRQMREGQGRLDRETLRQEWNQLMQAEQEGRLEEVLPGAGKLAQRAQGRNQAGTEPMNLGNANKAGRSQQEAR